MVGECCGTVGNVVYEGSPADLHPYCSAFGQMISDVTILKECCQIDLFCTIWHFPMNMIMYLSIPTIYSDSASQRQSDSFSLVNAHGQRSAKNSHSPRLQGLEMLLKDTWAV